MDGVRRIHGARASAYDARELPAVRVIVQSEVIEPLDNTDTETYRRVDVDVIATALGNDDVDDVLDDIAAQIEARILTATGEPWDTLVMHFPTAADLTIGDHSEDTQFSLRTRFRVEFRATDAETVG